MQPIPPETKEPGPARGGSRACRPAETGSQLLIIVCGLLSITINMIISIMNIRSSISSSSSVLLFV